MEDARAPLDARDASQTRQHGQVPVLRLGLGRGASCSIVSRTKSRLGERVNTQAPIRNMASPSPSKHRLEAVAGIMLWNAPAADSIPGRGQ